MNLHQLVEKYGDQAALAELRQLQSAAHEAHIAWSVTVGYFEQTQQTSKFFPALRPVFRKEMTESAKVARMKESFLTAVRSTRDDVTAGLLEALSSTTAGEKDACILTAIDALGNLPLPDCDN